MSDKKFSEFTLQTDSSNVAFVVGFNGSDNVRISPSNLIGSGFLPISGGTMTGNLLLQDNIQVQVGTGGDLKLYHNGTDSFIENQTGILKIQSSVVGGDISFLADNGSGTPTEYFRLDGGDTNINFQLDTLHPDNVKAKFGTSADLRIYHNGTNSNIENFTGTLQIIQNLDDGDISFRCDDGSGGVTEYFRLDGGNGNIITSVNNVFADDKKVCVGSSADLQIFHNGTNSLIENSTGDFYISNKHDDGDIIFFCDDGSGGTASYFSLDGSTVMTKFQKNVMFQDSVIAYYGTGFDFFITHDGSNTSMTNQTGDLTISNSADDKDIIFKSDDGSGGVTEYFRLDGGAEANIFSKNVGIGTSSPNALLDVDGGKIRISSSGTRQLEIGTDATISFGSNDNIQVRKTGSDLQFKTGGSERMRIDSSGDATFAGNVSLADSKKITFGDSDDLQIYHDGTDSFLLNNTGDLYLKNLADDKDINFQSDDGSGGFATYFRVDGSAVETRFLKSTLHFDNVKAQFGDSGDLQIFHDGSNSNFITSTTSDIYLRNEGDNDRIFIQATNSGTIANYLTIDGSQGFSKAHKKIRFLDNVQAAFGDNDDFKISHDGSDTYIQNVTSHLVIENQVFKLLKRAIA